MILEHTRLFVAFVSHYPIGALTCETKDWGFTAIFRLCFIILLKSVLRLKL